ncbi:MAG: hypothetical protein ACD_9C00260G0002 [uncultured bacterium]|nr:MAG: hypothetical protein ACD_9C00260G0002 [uncultured bacterium]
MSFIKKSFFYLLIFFFVASLLGIFFLYENRKNEEVRKGIFSFVANVKEFIYIEATIHNPEGDMVPDNWDNAVTSKIEKEINNL